MGVVVEAEVGVGQCTLMCLCQSRLVLMQVGSNPHAHAHTTDCVLTPWWCTHAQLQTQASAAPSLSEGALLVAVMHL